MGLISYYNGASQLRDYCQQNNNDFASVTHSQMPLDSQMMGPAAATEGGPSAAGVDDDASNGAIYFDSERLDILKDGPLLPQLQMTLGFWLKGPTVTGYATVISFASDFKDSLFSWSLRDRNRIIIILVAKSLLIDISDVTLDWNKWNHFTTVLDLEMRYLSVYINGQLHSTHNLRLFASFPLSNTQTSGANRMALGSRHISPTDTDGIWGYTGYLDEIAIYNRILNGTEIGDLHGNVGVPPSVYIPDPETAFWCFNELGHSNYMSAACSGRGNCTGYDECTCLPGSLSYKCQNRLQVSEYSSCPSNIISWWRAEGSTMDTCGRNNPEGWTNIHYSEGRIGMAFNTQDLSIVDSVLYSNPFSTGFPLTEFTICMWAKKQEGDSGTRFLLSYYLETQEANNMLIGYSATSLVLYIQGIGTTVPIPPEVDPYDWIYLSASWSSATAEINFYLNGQNISTVPNVKPGFQMDGGGSLMILNDQDCIAGCTADNQQFHGLLDEIVLYKEALTREQIRTLYENDGIIFNNCFGFFEIDPSVCGGKGICEGLDECRCTPPYTGEKCTSTYPGLVLQTVGGGQYGENGINYLKDNDYPGSVKRATGSTFMDREIHKIGCGWHHCLVSTRDHFLFGFGSNLNGSLGLGDTNPRLIPTEISAMRGVALKQICGRAAGTLLLAENGTLFSFGSGTALGNGKRNNSLEISQVDMSILAGKSVESIHCGADHHYVLTSDNNVYSWGVVDVENLDYNPLATDAYSEATVPIATKLPSTIISLASGDYHGLGLTTGNILYAWGKSVDGPVGAFGLSFSVPQQVSFFDSLQVDAIYAGGRSSFVTTLPNPDTPLNKTVWSFGRGTEGQLGQNDFTSKMTPQIVPLNQENYTVHSIYPTNQNTYILTQDGALLSTGSSEYGALGDSTSVNRASFSFVTYNPIEHKRYDMVSVKKYGALMREGPYCNSNFSLYSDTCNTKGKCVDQNTCDCIEGWHHTFCQTPECAGILATDSDVCLKRGQCTSYNQCACDAGYHGDNCEIFACFGLNNTDMGSVCSGHGSCTDIDQCKCDFGFTGSNCEKTSCFYFWEDETGVCSSHGKCVDRDVCKCDDGYFGSTCELEEYKKPVAILRAPSDIGLCDELLLDGSMSYGSGLVYHWSIVESDELALSHMLSESSDPRINIPSSLFSSYGSFTFVLRVENDEGYSDSLSIATATVNRRAVSFPQLVMTSLQYWNVTRAAAISLTARASAKNCRGESMGDISYSGWTQVSGSSVTLPSASSNGASLDLEPYSFPSEGIFEFELSATVGSKTTRKIATISVRYATLKAYVAGGSERTHYYDTPLILDASPSYDPDEVPEGETFEWMCTTFDSYSVPCNVTLPHQKVITLPKSSLPAGKYRFTLTYRKGSRHSMTSVVIDVTLNQLATVALPQNVMEMNRQKMLKLVPQVQSSSAAVVKEEWKVDIGSLALSKQTVVSGTWSQFLLRGELAIAPFVLSSSTIYALTYRAYTRLGIGYSQTQIHVRTPPRFSKLKISPQEGNQYETPFTVYVHDSEQSNAPLSFQYEYSHTETKITTVLKEYGSQNLLDNVVFPVSGTVRITVRIRDSLGAETTVSDMVKIIPASLAYDTAQDGVLLTAKSFLSGESTISLGNIYAAVDTLNSKDQAGSVHIASRIELRKEILSLLSSSSVPPMETFDVVKRLTTAPNELDTSLIRDATSKMRETICDSASGYTHDNLINGTSYMIHAYSNSMDAAMRMEEYPQLPMEVSQKADEAIQCASRMLRPQLTNGESSQVITTPFFELTLFQDTYQVLKNMASSSTYSTSYIGSSQARVKLSQHIGDAAGLSGNEEISVELKSFEYDYFSSISTPETMSRKSKILELNFYDKNQDIIPVHSLPDGIILEFRGSFNISSTLEKGKLFRSSVSGELRKGVARYWDTETKTWRTDGCKILDMSAHSIFAKCNHTTQFAVFSECMENCMEPPGPTYIWIIYVCLGVVLLLLILCAVCFYSSLGCLIFPFLFKKYRQNRKIQKIYHDQYVKALMNTYLFGDFDEKIQREHGDLEAGRDAESHREEVSIDNWVNLEDEPEIDVKKQQQWKQQTVVE